MTTRPNYEPRTAPFAHQQLALDRSYNKRAFALFMEQGLGKSKVIIDTCAMLYEAGVVRGLLLLAPNGVQHQWRNEQFPAHWPTRHALRIESWASTSTRSRRLCAELAAKSLPDRFHVLCMNHEAIITKEGRKCAERFLRTYPSMMCLDESHEFKTPQTQRTRAAMALGRLAPVRRIATGTPKTQSPFDYFSQMAFLDPRILGFDSFITFKHRYGVFSKERVSYTDRVSGERRVREYDSLQHYTRLDELRERLSPYSVTARKADCLDLPPKTYITRHVELSRKQRAAYEQLVQDGCLLLELAERGAADDAAVRSFLSLRSMEDEEISEALLGDGSRVTYSIKLVLMLRLHQIVGGHVTDDEGAVHAIDTDATNPRLTALLSAVEEHVGSSDQKLIVWATYRAELRLLERALCEKYEEQHADFALRIDGSVVGGERATRLARFKDPAQHTPQVLVAHPRTLGTGQNLTVANACWYYSNNRSWSMRAQSEDRVHRIGTRGSVLIGDIVAGPERVIDTKILESLKSHGELAEQFMKMTTKEIRAALTPC